MSFTAAIRPEGWSAPDQGHSEKTRNMILVFRTMGTLLTEKHVEVSVPVYRPLTCP